jgi:hypothetical protein
MIRIAHCSDLHYGPKNLAEADAASAPQWTRPSRCVPRWQCCR